MTCPPLEGHARHAPALSRSGDNIYPVSENHPHESWVFRIIKVLATFMFFLTCKIPSLGSADVQAWGDRLTCGMGLSWDRMGGFRAFFFFFIFFLPFSNILPALCNSRLLSKSPTCWLVALVPRWSTNALWGFPPSTQSLWRLQGRLWGTTREAFAEADVFEGCNFNELEALSKLLGVELLRFGQQGLVHGWFPKLRSEQGCWPQAQFPRRDKK